MKKLKKISHRKVQEAIENFQAEGGIIRKLPDQPFRKRSLVGWEKHNNFESLTSFISM